MRMRAALTISIALVACSAGAVLADPSPSILLPPPGSAAEPPASAQPAAPKDPARSDQAVSSPAPAQSVSPVPPPSASLDSQAAGQAASQVPAQAQSAPEPNAEEAGRYSFHRIKDSVIRLDTRTGQLSDCGWGANGWSCKLVPDERTALEGEIARLQGENAALKKALLSRGILPPGGAVAAAEAEPRPVPPADVPDPAMKQPKAPAEPNLDRAIGYVKDLWRRLVEMVADLQRDVQKKS